MNPYFAFAQNTAERAGAKLMKYFACGKPHARATAKSIKTIYDDIADKFIKKEIEKRFPSHSYLTEETGFVSKDKNYLWIIDPLDGTSNFVNANPFFAISFSLWYRGRPILGITEAPAIQERYYVQEKLGSWVYRMRQQKKSRARVSTVKDLSKSYLLMCDGGEKDLKKVEGIMHQFYPLAKDMRKLGSAAIELAWVGMGRADAYITPKISLWDIGAGLLFVKEAGGKLLNFSLQSYQFSDLLYKNHIDLVATNGVIQLPKIYHTHPPLY